MRELIAWYCADLDRAISASQKVAADGHANHYDVPLYAQAKQPAEQGEPVAWLHQICDDQGNGSVIASLNENIDLDASEVCVSTPLYAHPDPRIAAPEKALKELVSYTKACEGMLNASPAGQVLAAEAALGGP